MLNSKYKAGKNELRTEKMVPLKSIKCRTKPVSLE